MLAWGGSWGDTDGYQKPERKQTVGGNMFRERHASHEPVLPKCTEGAEPMGSEEVQTWRGGHQTLLKCDLCE